jgi:hypothetical protein
MDQRIRMQQTDAKRLYVAPQLTTINLRPEEAVLGHCKTMSSASQGGPCNPFLSPCVQTFGS